MFLNWLYLLYSNLAVTIWIARFGLCFGQYRVYSPWLWYSCWCKRQHVPVLEDWACSETVETVLSTDTTAIVHCFVDFCRKKRCRTIIWEKSHSFFYLPNKASEMFQKIHFDKNYENRISVGGHFSKRLIVWNLERQILQVKALRNWPLTKICAFISEQLKLDTV